jgi:hypothetical protein
MCPSGGPSVPAAKAQSAPAFSVPAGRATGKLRVDATLHYRKIDQFLLNYVMGEKSGLTAPVVDIASATADVCVTRTGDSGPCQ